MIEQKARVVRRIGSEELFIVVEESPTFYIGHPADVLPESGCELQLMRKENYKPGPQKTWRDVTALCSAEEAHLLLMRFSPGYRLRKELLERPLVKGGGIYTEQWAFVLEKEETP